MGNSLDFLLRPKTRELGCNVLIGLVRRDAPRSWHGINFLMGGKDRLPYKNEKTISKQKGCWAAPESQCPPPQRAVYLKRNDLARGGLESWF